MKETAKEPPSFQRAPFVPLHAQTHRKANSDATTVTVTPALKCLTRDLVFKGQIKRQVISFQHESQYPHSEISQ